MSARSLSDQLCNLPPEMADPRPEMADRRPEMADRRPLMFDLCAGIGGFSYALRPVARTVAYAEKDPKARAMLASLMTRGLLPEAPVIDDVAMLASPPPPPAADSPQSETPAETPEPALPAPDIVCAGFPCQDLSTTGLRKGLHGPRSSLFFTVRDVVARWKPALVFLENVPAIRRYMPVVADAMRAIGYECHYDVFSAKDVGAPHLRRRWYCLCRNLAVTTSPCSNVEALVTAEALGAEWAAPPAPDRRVTSGTLPGNRDRLHALGNSIVPQCARHAFAVLHARAFGLPPPDATLPPAWSAPVRIVLPPPPEVTRATRPALQTPVVVKDLYPTPRASSWSPPLLVSKRGISALAPQLVYQDTTPRVPTPRINPEFVEWMMGYPAGYTETAGGAAAHSKT